MPTVEREGNNSNGFKDVCTGSGSSQDQNLALTGFCVPSSLDSGPLELLDAQVASRPPRASGKTPQKPLSSGFSTKAAVDTQPARPPSVVWATKLHKTQGERRSVTDKQSHRRRVCGAGCERPHPAQGVGGKTPNKARRAKCD